MAAKKKTADKPEPTKICRECGREIYEGLEIVKPKSGPTKYYHKGCILKYQGGYKK